MLRGRPFLPVCSYSATIVDSSLRSQLESSSSPQSSPSSTVAEAESFPGSRSSSSEDTVTVLVNDVQPSSPLLPSSPLPLLPSSPLPLLPSSPLPLLPSSPLGVFAAIMVRDSELPLSSAPTLQFPEFSL